MIAMSWEDFAPGLTVRCTIGPSIVVSGGHIMSELLLSAIFTAFSMVRLIKGPWLRNPQYLAAGIAGSILGALVLHTYWPGLRRRFHRRRRGRHRRLVGRDAAVRHGARVGVRRACLDEWRSTSPPSVLPDISPQGGRSAVITGRSVAKLPMRSDLAAADLPPRGEMSGRQRGCEAIAMISWKGLSPRHPGLAAAAAAAAIGSAFARRVDCGRRGDRVRRLRPACNPCRS